MAAAPPEKIEIKDASAYRLFFVPGRIQAKRLQIMKNCAKKNGFCVSEKLDKGVTHLLTEFESEDQVLRNVDAKNVGSEVKIVSTKWLTDSVKQERPIHPIPIEYQLKTSEEFSSDSLLLPPKIDYAIYNCYACQRKTPLLHHNARLTDALEIVARHAELRDAEGDYVRALAFHKAAAVLKSLPFTISKPWQAAKLKDIGKHSLKIIGEILEDSYSSEVEQIKSDDWFVTLRLFNTVYGVGPVMAKHWYSLGLRSIADVKEKKLNATINFGGDGEKINYGLAFHDDLNTPVTKAEADAIFRFMKTEAEKILPGVEMEIVGGFRRGKAVGHDVDILFTHPNQGQETGLLQTLHQRLVNMGFILYGYVHKAVFSEEKLQQELNNPSSSQNANSIDDYEKCFYIFRMPIDVKHFDNCKLTGKTPPLRSEFSELIKLASTSRNWRAVRVDLILSPANQYPYALVGWTGNKNFNRRIRNYAKKRLNMRLTSNGLWSYATLKLVPASNEKELFSHLQLEYLEPWERNV